MTLKYARISLPGAPLKAAVFLTCFFFSALLPAAVLKIASLAPDGSDWMNRMKAGAKEVAEQTNNRVRFKFYPGGVMGDDKAVLRKMRIGQLQGAAMPSGGLAQVYLDSQVYNLPLVFRSFEEIDYVRERMDPMIVEGFERGGIVTFGLSEAGFAFSMSKTPISSLGDLKKLKVWVPDNDKMGLVTMNAFDIQPIPLSIGDVLTGLQTGLINTIASPPVGAIALQWHNQVSYLTDLPLMYIYATLAIDKKAFAKIAPDDQAIVREIMNRTFKGIDRQNRKDNLAAFAALKTQGIELIEPDPEELEVWRKKAHASWDLLVQQGQVSQKMVDTLDRHLAEFRAGKTAQ